MRQEIPCLPAPEFNENVFAKHCASQTGESEAMGRSCSSHKTLSRYCFGPIIPVLHMGTWTTKSDTPSDDAQLR